MSKLVPIQSVERISEPEGFGVEQAKQLEIYREKASQPLASAEALPFSAYEDEAVFQQEKRSIFQEDWLFICAEQEIPAPGDYFALTVVGEPIVLLRGKDGVIRALSNVCRHRGTPLLDEGFGQVSKLIVCPYHAWAYDDTGACKAVPLPGDQVVKREEHCLPRFHLESWQGLLFVSFAEQPVALQERLEGMDDYLAAFDISRFQQAVSGGIECWASNWKLAVENAMESYHLFKVHEKTLETVTPTKAAFYVAGYEEWTLTAGKMIDSSSGLLNWFKGKTPEVYEHYVLISLPPTFVAILSYDSLGWIQVLPTSRNECFIRSGYITEAGSGKEDKGSQSFTKAFFQEDKEICERMQKGMSARMTQGGKLVELERVVVDFHRYLANRLFDCESGDFYQSEESELFLAGYPEE